MSCWISSWPQVIICHWLVAKLKSGSYLIRERERAKIWMYEHAADSEGSLCWDCDGQWMITLVSLVLFFDSTGQTHSLIPQRDKVDVVAGIRSAELAFHLLQSGWQNWCWPDQAMVLLIFWETNGCQDNRINNRTQRHLNDPWVIVNLWTQV